MPTDDTPSNPTLTLPGAIENLPTTPAAPGAELPWTVDRYERKLLIGRGGMGEVVLARDTQIGRDVAVKRMHAADPTPEATARFLREAQIQARLEHPAIPPVHEVSRDASGRPYFTMKRLAGVTLAQLLEAPNPPPRQRLLRAFAEVCNAVGFAHSRDVIHRDLKPANIMLGEFGEVYVLDWGVARVVDGSAGIDSVEPAPVDVIAGATQAGTVLGTLGFMPPEQARGERDVGPAADVYALGAILFEMLAGEPLHPRTSPEAFHSTLAGGDTSPSHRRPEREIPPELDAICTAALALDPADRPTARAIAGNVQDYLDGDRDVELRRQLAAHRLAAATAALSSDADPAAVMFAAGQALALDPASSQAAALVTRLMLEPPDEPPPDLAARIHETDLELGQVQARTAARSFLAYYAFLPFMFIGRVTSWPWVIGVYGIATVFAMFAESLFPIWRTRMGWVIALNTVLMILLTRLFGPFVIVPALIGSVVVTLTHYPSLIDRVWLVIGAMAVAFLAPIGLEWLGVFDSTWSVSGGSLTTHSTVIELDERATVVLLVTVHVALIIVNGLFARSLAVSRRDAQRRLEIQAWRLRQLLPG